MEEIVKSMEANIGLIIYVILAFSLVLAIAEFCYELYKKKIDKWRLEKCGQASPFLLWHNSWKKSAP